MAKRKEKTKIDWPEDKKEAAFKLIELLGKEQGEGAATMGNIRQNVEAVPTGALTLDLALGVGGIPRGRVTEIYGPESSGKTTLMLSVCANAQKQGGQVAFIDAEHALDAEYAAKIGLDVDKMVISQPDCGENALDAVELMCESNAFDVIVIDSVAALVPRAELDGNVGDHHVGAQARMLSQALRKICSKANKSDTAVIFINQLREKIGVMFGNPETTPGGRALKFYSSVRLDIRRIATVKDGGEASGNQVRVKVVKNKVAPPFKQAEFRIMWGMGIDKAHCVLELGVEHGFVTKKGNFYSVGEIKLGNGATQACNHLRHNLPLLEELEVEILDKIEKENAPIIMGEDQTDDKSEDDEDDGFDD